MTAQSANTTRPGQSPDESGDLFIPDPVSDDYAEQVERAWRVALPELSDSAQAIPLFAVMDVASALLGSFHQRTLKRRGHNYTEYAILSTLLLNTRGVRPSVFTELLGKASAGTTHALNKLEKNGLIVREQNPVDKRSVIVALTEAGGEVARDLCAAEAAESQRLTRHLSKTDLNQLRTAVGTIIEILN